MGPIHTPSTPISFKYSSFEMMPLRSPIPSPSLSLKDLIFKKETFEMCDNQNFEWIFMLKLIFISAVHLFKSIVSFNVKQSDVIESFSSIFTSAKFHKSFHFYTNHVMTSQLYMARMTPKLTIQLLEYTLLLHLNRNKITIYLAMKWGAKHTISKSSMILKYWLHLIIFDNIIVFIT